MKKIRYFLGGCALLLIVCGFKDKRIFIKENFDIEKQQLYGMLTLSKDTQQVPRSINPDGSLKTVGIYDWTSGFFAGNLWYTYEYTHDEFLKNAAIKWTEALEPLQSYTEHHDLGFMLYCSYGNAYRLTGNEKYKAVLIAGAKSLASRFNSKVGCIKSWNQFSSWDGHSKYNFPVIIDNMMNLELLFFASKATGNPCFKNIAIKHAETTMRNHFRSDYSSYHVVNYDSSTGGVLSRETVQGFADNSAWARGQAWALYGFTMVYRETRDPRFLEIAQKIANYIIHNKNLPKDKIPNWDFNANQPGFYPKWNYNAASFKIIPKDASSAATISAALLELSLYAGKSSQKYRHFAEQILFSLANNNYRAEPGTNNFFLLKHSVGSIPHHEEIDVPLIYADYYFLEALNRYNNLK